MGISPQTEAEMALINPEQRKALEKAAEAEGLSLDQWVRQTVIQRLTREGYLKPGLYDQDRDD